MNEIEFERKCVERLRSLKHSYWPDKVESFAIRGEPDRIGCVKGMYIAIEFKKSQSEANRTTGRIVLQKRKLEAIRAAGGRGYVVYPENWEQVFREICKITCELKAAQ